MDGLIQTSQLILSLCLLVFIHELGHFMFAKWFGARVEKFYLFFNPWFSIVKFKKGDTEYGLGWIPMGGFVKISGMVDESMDKEQLAQEPQPYEFRSKPAWQRLLIMTGGVMMNVVLAIVIYAGISYTYGTSYISNKDAIYGYTYNPIATEMGFKNGDIVLNIDGEEVDNHRDITMAVIFDGIEYIEIDRQGEHKKIYMDDSYIKALLDNKEPFIELRIPVIIDSVLVAKEGGLLANDKIIAVNGEESLFFDQFKTAITSNANKEVAITVERDSAGVEITKIIPVAVSADSTIGIFPLGDLSKIYPIKTKKYTLLESIPQGCKLAVAQIDNYIKQLKLLVSPDTGAYKSVGSVISMGSMFDTNWDWFRFWSITALLSIVLAVMNILPIPALDGGHVVFLIYEVITRRKPSDKFMEYSQVVGMFLLLALMVFALGNDIYKLFQ